MTHDLADVPLMRIDGSTTTLGAFQGKVLLIVNVASKCGLTPQYTALERLYEAKSGQGFEILGFPCNDFAGQEPGSDAEIATFCDQLRRAIPALLENRGEGRRPTSALSQADRRETARHR